MDSHVTWTVDPDTGATMPKFDRAVTSEPLREYIKGVITNGVLPNPSNNLQVSAGTNGMTVIVQAGFCVIEGGLAIEPNTRTLEVTSADSTYDRIDTVVARWDSNDATRRVDLHIVKGVPASHPVRPTLTRNESIYELGLADVFVTKGVATITNEKITDTRMESARCGICSSISEWDTTTIYQQVQADLKQFKSSEQTAFMEWFDQMKDQLSEDAAGHLQEEVDDVNKKIHTNLLNPTLGTTTVNGVTCTANGDGTYTLNGTCTAFADVRLTPWGIEHYNECIRLKAGKYKLVGCPRGGGNEHYIVGLVLNDGATRPTTFADTGNGYILNHTNENIHYEAKLTIYQGQTYNNLTFKPMLTTDLSATYDDFVQYSGDGELNENVAEMHANKQDKTDNALTTTAKTIVGAINELLGKFADYFTKSEINTKLGNYYTKTESNNLLNAKQNKLASTQIWNSLAPALHNAGLSGWTVFSVANYKYIFILCTVGGGCVSAIIPCDVIRQHGTAINTTTAKPVVLYAGGTFAGQWTVISKTEFAVYAASGVHVQLFGVY